MNPFKRTGRRLVRPEHWRGMGWCRRRFGLTSACASYISLLWHPEFFVIRGRCANLSSHIRIRPGTADQDVYNEVFLRHGYDIDGIFPKTIVDAGAHIGLVSVMLAHRFSDATVIAIEPEPGNFRLLTRNTRNYRNIRTLQAGLWGHPATLRIRNPIAETWAFQVVEGTEKHHSIPAASISQLMGDFGLQYIGVLKIDIEGSEIEVLASAESWIGRVGVLMIELHDRFRPGCAQALDRALAGYDFERRLQGNTVVIRDIRQRVS